MARPVAASNSGLRVMDSMRAYGFIANKATLKQKATAITMLNNMS